MIAVFFVTDSLTQFSAGICILILSPIVFLQKTKSFFNLVFLYLMDQIKLFFCGAANCFSGYLYFPTPGPGSGPQFVFTGPADPQFVFTGPVPQFVFNSSGAEYVFTGPGYKFVFSGSGPKFVFTGIGI